MSDNQDKIVTSLQISKPLDEEKNTALHYAATQGDEIEVQNLIDKKHKIDPENFLGWTPLMVAAKNGHLEIINILLNNHADSSRTNKYGVSVFLIAIANGNLEMVKILLEHLLYGGVSKQSLEFEISPISVAIEMGHLDVASFLLDKSFNIDVQMPEINVTPLMVAAVQDTDDAFNMLIQRGADSNVKSLIKITAIDMYNEKRSQKKQIVKKTQTNLQPPPLVHIDTTYAEPNDNSIKKSPNTIEIVSPNLTPISPVFYPPVISPNLFYSPHPITPLSFYSPIPHPQYIMTPYHNVLNMRLDQIQPQPQYFSFDYSMQ